MRAALPAAAAVTIALAASGCAAHVDDHAPRGAARGLPVSFAANHGQFAPRVRYAARGAGYELAATDAGLELALHGRRVRIALAGARRRSPAAAGRLPGVANYLIGRDQRRWRTGVPTYREVVYRRAWPGIDVALYGAAGRFEYDLRVAPGADPRAARLAFGGSRARIERDGTLRVGPLRQLAPSAYQWRGGRRIAVASRYARHADGTIGVRVGRYDRRRALVIDPVLAYSTYLGGSGTDDGTAIAVDGAGSAYVVGQTQSTAFPAAGTLRGGADAFVSKLAPNGSALAWSTYLGGGDLDQANGVAVGEDGVVVGGWTTSTDFPTKTPVQGANAGIKDAFLVKLSPGGGAPVWGTYLGGSGSDEGTGVAVDPAGNAYLVGTTDSANFHAANAFQIQHGGGSDAFAAKVNASGALVYSTYLGGGGNDVGAGVTADGAGNAHLTGATGSTDFPTTNALQPANAGSLDAFVTKLGPAGGPVYSTYLGGAGYDVGTAIARTPAGAPVVVGSTQSPAFPTIPGAPQGGLSGPSDAFVARLTTAGTVLAASTYLGGSGVDAAGGVAVDREGRTVVAGRTLSTDFPTVSPAQPVKGGALDATVTQLDALGTTLLSSTYLGGNGEDQAEGVAVDGDGNAYVTGRTGADFPTASALQGTSSGGLEAFVTKLAIGSAPPPAGGGGPGAVDEPAAVAIVGPARPPAPVTTITARPPAMTPDQVVQFRFRGYVPGQINPSGGVTFSCRVDGGSFRPCTSPYTTARLALAEHRFEVRAMSVGGGVDPTPPGFTFRVTQPPPEVRRHVCALKPVGDYHDRGTRDWGPCDFPEIVCPRAAACLLDLAVDEHDESYLFNYDVHLLRYDEYAPGRFAYRDKVFCFAPSLSTPVNPKLEVRFDPRRGEYNRRHACHADGALGLVDTTQDHRERLRCAGLGHAPKPGGDRTTGSGVEQDAHLECLVTVTIQRHVTELADVVSDSPKDGASLLVYLPQPGSVTVTATTGTRVVAAAARTRPALSSARRTVRAAGVVRVPLRLNRAAVKLRRRRALRVALTMTFQPKVGEALTRVTTIRLRRRR
jgi:hypothetical protein